MSQRLTAVMNFRIVGCVESYHVAAVNGEYAGRFRTGQSNMLSPVQRKNIEYRRWATRVKPQER